MDFDSPDVMKDFPGLYASEFNKKCSNDSDYSDENEKAFKKDANKKKERKDKERGYAALEGESSDENCKSKSPSKSKKTKSFKFATKTKEKRDKSREKEVIEKKKDKEKKIDKKTEKDKGKKVKSDEALDIAEVLPIFGASLDDAVQRGPCHDGIGIPLPLRQCIDYIETIGISFEGLYKVSGTKSKVLHIKKLYNQRENVDLNDYDVPTITSLLKAYLRDLPEPIFTSDLLIRFEEAGAILNANTREKHLKILLENLPPNNKFVLSYLIVHLDNVSLNEKINKMGKQNLAAALNHTFHCSSRLLGVLIQHCYSLFPNIVTIRYIPPLSSGAQLPEEPELIQIELKKQESLLNQIHKEISVGCISKQREELLWEVQRIITQLKRKLKSFNKDKEIAHEEKEIEENVIVEKEETPIKEPIIIPSTDIVDSAKKIEEIKEIKQDDGSDKVITEGLLLLKLKNESLRNLKDNLNSSIQAEKSQITQLKAQLQPETIDKKPVVIPDENLDQVIGLLQKENQILQIKKINLVRQIVEQQEMCIDLKARIAACNNNNNNKI